MIRIEREARSYGATQVASPVEVSQSWVASAQSTVSTQRRHPSESASQVSTRVSTHWEAPRVNT